MVDYGNVSYWDERYASEETNYDWYQDFHALKPALLPFLRKDAEFEVLIPGCGNSSEYAIVFLLLGSMFKPPMLPQN
jgi:hypothetical protein